ncbi:MAG: alpha/beta fold hydrolase [Bacteroidota bacterium]
MSTAVHPGRAQNENMDSTPDKNFIIPKRASYIQQGTGSPVILIHGMAASYHNWDDLSPLLVENGYSFYALDLLGHGDSPKPASRAYRMEWLFEHFAGWMDSLHLTETPILIGHSLGGYLALEYARRFTERARGLVLVNPLYSLSQLPPLLRRTYRRPHLSGFIIEKTPPWMFRLIVDMSSVAMGNGTRALHSLPERVRAQTALDYGRTSPGAYNIINHSMDLDEEHLASIPHPALVIWGDRDQTLAPSSFPKLVNQMPRATGRVLRAGHVPHQSNTEEFNQIVIAFLKELS